MREKVTGDGRTNRPPDGVSAPRRRRDRAAWWGGMLASALLHAFVLFGPAGRAPEFERLASRGTNPELRVGGGGLQSVRISPPRRVEIPPPPRPVLAVDAPEIEVRETAPEISADLLPVGAPTLPAGRAAAAGPGEGEGGGGTDGYISPVPRSVVPHWDPPGSVRGMEVTVRVFVDATGRPSLVELDPPTPDEGFNRDIVRQVRAWEYRPARRDGAAVEGWAEITFIF